MGQLPMATLIELGASAGPRAFEVLEPCPRLLPETTSASGPPLNDVDACPPVRFGAAGVPGSENAANGVGVRSVKRESNRVGVGWADDRVTVGVRHVVREVQVAQTSRVDDLDRQHASRLGASDRRRQARVRRGLHRRPGDARRLELAPEHARVLDLLPKGEVRQPDDVEVRLDVVADLDLVAGDVGWDTHQIGEADVQRPVLDAWLDGDAAVAPGRGDLLEAVDRRADATEARHDPRAAVGVRHANRVDRQAKLFLEARQAPLWRGLRHARGDDVGEVLLIDRQPFALALEHGVGDVRLVVPEWREPRLHAPGVVVAWRVDRDRTHELVQTSVPATATWVGAMVMLLVAPFNCTLLTSPTPKVL